MEITNEFASVQVDIDHEGNGPRLKLTDRKSGAVRHLDPLELESLVWAPDELFTGLVDPKHRWRAED